MSPLAVRTASAGGRVLGGQVVRGQVVRSTAIGARTPLAIVGFALAAIVCSGCGPDRAAASARTLPCAAAVIAVTDVQSRYEYERWTATCEGRHYRCRQNSGEPEPRCNLRD